MVNKINNIVLYILIFFSIYCALIIGISWDELAVIDRGNEKLKYLFSFGFYDYIEYRDQRFYPGFYNTLVALITKIFPKKIELEILHLTNNLFSISTIFGISKISKELFNKKVGQIVFLLCFINPIFFGHLSINPKDMIVAFSNVWATYLIIKYLKNHHIDEKRNRYTIFMGLVVGLGVGVRLVFLGTLIPIILISFFDILFLKKITDKKLSYKKFLIDFFKIFVIAYIIMVSCWPETHQNIFILPFKLLYESFHYQFGPPIGLLNGNFYYTAESPKYYLATNLLYKLPEFILFTYVISIFIILKDRSFFASKFKFFNIKIILIIFIIIFPNILFLFSPYRIYDGLRLFLYLIPYICIIPGLSIYYLIINYKNYISKILLTTVFFMFLYYLSIFFLLTPYQYTYLNILNGNYSKSYNKFENDYWVISLKELINQIPKHQNLLNNKKIKLAFCGVPDTNAKFYLKKIENFNFEPVNYLTQDYEYIIMNNRIAETNTNNSLKNTKTCFEEFKGLDIITVKRNGLILSTLRKKLY